MTITHAMLGCKKRVTKCITIFKGFQKINDKCFFVHMFKRLHRLTDYIVSKAFLC